MTRLLTPTVIDCMSRFSIFRWGKPKSDAETSSGDAGRFVADSIDRKKTSEKSGAADPHLPEKKKARRRLVGSVTLVLAAIIVLPMIFESRPKQVSPNLLIDIPSKDKSMQAASDQAVSPPAASRAVQPDEKSAISGMAPAPQPERNAGQSSNPVTPAADASVKDSAAPAPQEQSVDAQNHEKDRQKAAEKQARAEKEKQLKAEKAKQEKAKAGADADPIGQMIAEKSSSRAKPEKPLIQVAALTSQQKVNELQARLSKAGIPSHTQKVKSKNGEERIRVRIGPFSSKGEVDNACSRLRAMGLSCTPVSK
ncbi:SPOR domain-containing protein [Oxalobacter paraformigenes]|nr:SPOR domain-containing protein [Oxalobacter paraformigenes]